MTSAMNQYPKNTRRPAAMPTSSEPVLVPGLALKRPGFPRASLTWSPLFRCCLDIQLFVLGGRQVTEFFVQSLLVVEADPVQRLMLGVLVAGEAAPVDELGLEGRDPRFGHRVVIGIAA